MPAAPLAPLFLHTPPIREIKKVKASVSALTRIEIKNLWGKWGKWGRMSKINACSCPSKVLKVGQYDKKWSRNERKSRK